MTPENYLTWAAERAGITPQPIADSAPVTPVAPDPQTATFRCDPFACRKVCCTGWPEGRGPLLTVADLVALNAAGHLESAGGHFAPAEDVAAWRAEPEDHEAPERPYLRSVDDHCLHYDPETRRCGIWEHRPLICRTYPFAVDWVAEDGTVHLTFGEGCSRVTSTAHRVALARGERVPRPFIALKRSAPTTTLGALGDYVGGHLQACLESAEEQARTLDLVSTHPELLDELGLGRFRSPA